LKHIETLVLVFLKREEHLVANLKNIIMKFLTRMVAVIDAKLEVGKRRNGKIAHCQWY
jgi:hypothetical protein